MPGLGAGDLGIGKIPTNPPKGPAQNRIMIPPHDGCCPLEILHTAPPYWTDGVDHFQPEQKIASLSLISTSNEGV